MNIVIVDDSVTIRKVLRRSLVAAGIEDGQIGEAADGLVALDILKAQRVPTLVLCDVTMPGMSGEALLQEAMKLETKHTFVMVTSLATTRKKIELIRKGAVKVIPKPFDPTTLADIIGPYLPYTGTLLLEPAAAAAPPLAPLPDEAALTTLGLAALQSVLGQMAFTDVLVANEAPPAEVMLFGASVRLDAGECRWIVRLAADGSAAGELSGRLTGQDPGDDQGVRLDAMREVANIVAGDLVTRTARRFRGATPSVPTSAVLAPGTANQAAMRGVRLVPGDYHVWLDVAQLP
jgi:two-component system chemotaxis response regulator CheY